MLSGVVDVPRLEPHRRLSDAERKRIGEVLRREYEAGRSVRELCADTGYSIGRVRRLLIDAGATFRPRGGARRRRTSTSTSSAG